ncbi:hypothetical protein [Aquipuribacter hungaricus]|uniref:Uncharacterized protein n=1 Tax=Aquipuribacter hungaricus TaxID=545624 RepID=A0ABV7WG44_9MICO
MRVDEDPAPVAALRAAVDAVLVPRGFAAGQGGADGTEGQIVWCAAADELAARAPALPTSREPPDGWRGRCTDLVVDLAVADGSWCITGVSLEGQHLDRVLVDLGQTAPALRAAALAGPPVREGIVALPSLLMTLLDSPPGR